MGNTERGFGLAEVMQKLRNEIEQMEKNAEDQKYYFDITRAEVELSFTVKKGAHGGVEFLVFSIGGGGSKENTHRIKLDITPLVKVDGQSTDTAKPRGIGFDLETTTGASTTTTTRHPRGQGQARPRMGQRK
jgi:hypothetical protein